MYFYLKQKQHKNSHEIVESNDSKYEKVMIFVIIVDDKAPIVLAFVDENGRYATSNVICNLALFNEVLLLAFCSSVTRREYWWMQDGTPAHCTTDDKGFSRLISRATEIGYPTHSPDLNQLDI